MSTHLFLFAKITPKPEYYENAKAALIGILEPTMKEPGCYEFTLHQDFDKQCLYLYEEWENQAALDEHYDMPYTKAVATSYPEWLAQPVEIQKFCKVVE